MNSRTSSRRSSCSILFMKEGGLFNRRASSLWEIPFSNRTAFMASIVARYAGETTQPRCINYEPRLRTRALHYREARVSPFWGHLAPQKGEMMTRQNSSRYCYHWQFSGSRRLMQPPICLNFIRSMMTCRLISPTRISAISWYYIGRSEQIIPMLTSLRSSQMASTRSS